MFSLTQKGVLLICIPLVFEILFIGIFYDQLRRAESNLRREAIARDMVARANEPSRLSMDAGATLAAYKVTDNEMFGKRFHAILDQVPNELESFKRLADYEPSQADVVERAANTFLKIMDVLRQVEVIPHITGSEPAAIVRGNRLTLQIESLTKQLNSDEQTIKEAIRADQEQSTARATRSRNIVLTLLFAGLLLNVVAAIVLAVGFSRGIVSRLAVLLDNTVRFSRSDKLNEPLGDDDEIGDLDHVFHKMADQLTESMNKERAAIELKQELTQMVSHDLRAPLTNIQAVLNLLSLGALGDISDKAQLRVQAAEMDSKRLIGLINDLLDLDKLDAGKMILSLASLNVAEAVEAAIASVEPTATQSEIRISLNDGRVSPVVADRGRIIQVLVNLLSNAIKFAPEKSEIKVTLKDSGQFVSVFVHDDGPGVGKEFQSTIFERFRQLPQKSKSGQEGSGLGLPIAKLIIELHGGKIGVDSEEGKGSTFWFQLPKA
jgi:signal transduction histidine kinase